MRPKKRCPFYSRAFRYRCELRDGHRGLCVNNGDSFLSGFSPEKPTKEPK